MNPEIVILDYDSCCFCHHCPSSAHSKPSGGSLVFQKLARKLGRIKGSGGESAAASSSAASSGEKVDKSGFKMSRKKSRTQSFEGVDG